MPYGFHHKDLVYINGWCFVLCMRVVMCVMNRYIFPVHVNMIRYMYGCTMNMLTQTIGYSVVWDISYH